MAPNETKETAETIQTERVSGGRRVGLWKVLAASLFIVVIGLAIVAGVNSNPA
jgi:hypothetical protein